MYISTPPAHAAQPRGYRQTPPPTRCCGGWLWQWDAVNQAGVPGWTCRETQSTTGGVVFVASVRAVMYAVERGCGSGMLSLRQKIPRLAWCFKAWACRQHRPHPVIVAQTIKETEHQLKCCGDNQNIYIYIYVCFFFEIVGVKS